MPTTRVTVLGSGLAGMAAAARLAKAGHAVTLVPDGRFGGRYAPHPLAPEGPMVDDLAPVITFPAPWRDLFKKCGRAFDAELTRHNLALTPAPAARHEFADGSRLDLPAERGAQVAAVRAAFDTAAAERWRDLLDHYDEVWLALRMLGVEREFTGRAQLTRPVRRLLAPRRSVEHVARTLTPAPLADLVRAVAWRLGGDPRLTPNWVLAELSIERTFGRWQLVSTATEPAVAQPAGRLVDLLENRLVLRRVSLEGAPDAPDAVVDTRVPAVKGLRPRRVPSVRHTAGPADDTPPGLVTEKVTHRLDAGPLVTYRRVLDDGCTLTSSHDHAVGEPEPSAGYAYQGWRTLLRLPSVRTGDPQLYRASAASPAGTEPWAQLLSAALATYACHETLTGEDIRPTNKATSRRR